MGNNLGVLPDDRQCVRATPAHCRFVFAQPQLYSTFASSAPTTTSFYIAKEFGVSDEITYLITTLFLVGYVIGPIIWGPGSELFGRKPVFWVAMTCYTLFHLGQALAPNMQTLLVTRFLGGLFAVAPLTNCGGKCSV